MKLDEEKKTRRENTFRTLKLLFIDVITVHKSL